MSINKILIGIVGYSPVLDSYPLGPNLMNNLKERDWANINVDVQNMTWSPIHVTQRLQENKLEFVDLQRQDLLVSFDIYIYIYVNLFIYIWWLKSIYIYAHIEYDYQR